MDSRIPDFGRGSTDQVGNVAAELMARRQKKPAPATLHAATDQVDLRGALDEPPAKKKWTVLFYVDGNNSLYGPAYMTMKNLEGVGSNDDVNLVVEIGADPGKGGHGGVLESIMDAAMKDKKIETVKRYLVTKDTTDSPTITSPELQDLGKQDMGDAKVVSDFLKWGIKKFPAENYAVVLFNHGAGFAGILSDENTGSLLNTQDLKKVVDEAAQAAGQKIGVVDLDACLMAQAEVGKALEQGARYMVASEETERGMAQPLATVMQDLQEGSKDQAMAPADLARLFVYEAFHQPEGAILTCTLSAVDLEKINDVTKSAAHLAEVVKAGGIDPAAFRDDVTKAENFCQGEPYKLYNDFHDLGHFAALLQADPRIQDPAAQKAAGDLLAAVKGAVLAEEHSGKSYENSSGLSTYLPTNYGFDPTPRNTDSVNFAKTHNYKETLYDQETGWSDMLTTVAKDSTWHNFLKTFGLSKEGIDSLDSKLALVGGITQTATKAMLGVGKIGGTYEAFQALKAGVPKNFFFLGSTLATRLGVAGGAYQIFSGVKDLYNACQDDAPKGPLDTLLGSTTRKVNAGITIAQGAALTAVNAALLLGLSAGITTTAGILAFALPAAKIIYDAIAIRNNIKERMEDAQNPPPPPDTHTVAEKLKEVTDQQGHLSR